MHRTRASWAACRYVALGLQVVIGLALFSIIDTPAYSQSNTLSPEGINGLIESLRGVEERLGTGLLNQPDRELDRIRERAAEDFGFSSDDPNSGSRTPEAPRLTTSQLIIAERFCRGEATARDELVLRSLMALSPLEREYCTRAGQVLFQFGYEAFGGRLAPDFLLNGAVGDSYVMGRGDELVVSFRGREARTLTTKIDREGRLILPDFAPIVAMGITFGQLRERLEAATRATFIGTEVFVSLGALRRIGVLVAGEVASPGLQQTTAETTLIDAIGLAGGVLKSGSLRRIQVISRGVARDVDLYDLLTASGGASDFLLKDGDRIVVPTIGATVAIAGDVARGRIFELANGETGALVDDLIALGGGAVRPRGNRLTIVRSSDQGGQEITEVQSNSGAQLMAGDLLLVSRLGSLERGSVQLAGNVRIPGQRSLVGAQTISQLISAGDALREDAYLPLAVLETIDPGTQAKNRHAIDLSRVVARVEDFLLTEGDSLTVFSTKDIRFLSSPDVQRILDGGNSQLGDGAAGTEPASNETSNTANAAESVGSTRASDLEDILQRLQPASGASSQAGVPATTKTRAVALQRFQGCQSLDHLYRLVRFSGTRPRFPYAQFIAASDIAADRTAADECPEIFELRPDLLSFLLEHGSVVRGEVRRPGIYPIVEGSRLATVVSSAGGATRNAANANLERAAGANVGSLQLSVDLRNSQETMGPGDILRVNPVFSELDGGQVRLVGEFVQPGTYSFMRGETLSQVIARAQGLTAQAYPFGAIFTRNSVRLSEEQSLRRLARELNAAVTVAAANRGIDPNAVTAFARLTRDISESPASGRVVIEADPVVLAVRPELDVVLQPGDQIFVPRRPNSVLVTGDVLNPGAMQFVAGRSVDAYIRQAGSFQQSADKNRVFVVLPNGVAQPVAVSAFNFTAINVPPGSVIVVPKDATPFNAFTIARELSSVLSQLAITAASLAVIGNN